VINVFILMFMIFVNADAALSMECDESYSTLERNLATYSVTPKNSVVLRACSVLAKHSGKVSPMLQKDCFVILKTLCEASVKDAKDALALSKTFVCEGAQVNEEELILEALGRCVPDIDCDSVDSSLKSNKLWRMNKLWKVNKQRVLSRYSTQEGARRFLPSLQSLLDNRLTVVMTNTDAPDCQQGDLCHLRFLRYERGYFQDLADILVHINERVHNPHPVLLEDPLPEEGQMIANAHARLQMIVSFLQGGASFFDQVMLFVWASAMNRDVDSMRDRLGFSREKSCGLGGIDHIWLSCMSAIPRFLYVRTDHPFKIENVCHQMDERYRFDCSCFDIESVFQMESIYSAASLRYEFKNLFLKIFPAPDYDAPNIV